VKDKPGKTGNTGRPGKGKAVSSTSFSACEGHASPLQKPN